MTAVRPPIWPTVQPAATPVRGGRSAAFFEAALAKAGAEPVQTIRTEPRAQAPAEPQPGKILRPGSLLDIKV